MTITNGYCTLQDVLHSDRLKISDGDSNAVLEGIIEAASRIIDQDRDRFFYTLSSTALYFTAEESDILFVPDLLSVTTLATDDNGLRTYATTWSATDYDLMPHNAAALGKPYGWIQTTPNGLYSFPTLSRGVKITGTWGYAATVPKPVKEACILMVTRVFKRAKAPFGVIGSSELGQTLMNVARDPDIRMLLDSIPKRPGVYSV